MKPGEAARGRGPRYTKRFHDHTPGPYPGRGPIYVRRGETPETRAFRRYPINRHKPRFDK